MARALPGTVGTCVLILQGRLRLVPAPAARRTVVLRLADGPAAADAVAALVQHQPSGLEGFDDALTADVRRLGLHRSAWELLPGWARTAVG